MQENETGVTEEVEEFIEREHTQLRAHLKAARDTIDALTKEISDLKLANAKLRERAESEVKSALIDDIRKISDYGIEYLSTCTIDRLEQIKEDSKMLKRLRFSSSGDLGGKKNPRDKLYTMYKFGRKE